MSTNVTTSQPKRPTTPPPTTVTHSHMSPSGEVIITNDNAASSQLRRKRKWDQPHESLVSCGVVSAMLPMSTMGCPGISLPGTVSSFGTFSANTLNVGYVNLAKEIQAPILQQQAAAVVQKLIQPKIQEDLIIAREIVINDADPAIRYKLTKRQTQEEIQKVTGAVVITRGKYRPPNAVPDGQKPLYLHISAGAQIKETVERIQAVDRAAAMVEDMMKQVSQPLSTCVYLGFDADPSLDIAARIRGPNDQYINHIKNETGASVLLRGRGSGHLGNIQGEDGQQPMHLVLSCNTQKSLEEARLLAENLLDTISRECGATRVTSCKVYGAVPPPQQLLIGVQTSGPEMTSNLSSGASLAGSLTTSVPSAPFSSVVVPGVTTASPYGQVAPTGGLVSSGPSITTGFSHSQPPSSGCTSYSGYAGIYPQATPLQQVALALRQSSSVTSTVSPATSATSMVTRSSSETEKRPPHKRKFQESWATLMGAAVVQQGLGIRDPYQSSSSTEEKNGSTVEPPKKLDCPTLNGTAPASLKSMLPPPPPRNISSMPPPNPRSMPPPPPPPKFNSSVPVSKESDGDNVLQKIIMPPPSLPPKFTSSVPVSKAIEKNNTPNKLNPTAVPDTLFKLLEYGDDDDDTEENEHEPFKSNPNRIAASKPFWAV